jgi:hypothetical protein
MHTRIQLLAAWFIPAFIVTYLVGFIRLSGFVPPPTEKSIGCPMSHLFLLNSPDYWTPS